MVKQFQKPKGNGGRQRKFCFGGQNYCFVSWFRENKPFRARIHFGSTYSIGTYSDLEECLLAIAQFTKEKVMETTGLERRGWQQRDDKASSQYEKYMDQKDMAESDSVAEKETMEIERHFALKKSKKKGKLSMKVKKEKNLHIPLRAKLMQKTSPSIPPMKLKLETDLPPIKIEEDYNAYVPPIKIEEGYSSNVAPINLSLSPINVFIEDPSMDIVQDSWIPYSPDVSNETFIAPALSPHLSNDTIHPPHFGALEELRNNFRMFESNFGDKNDTRYRANKRDKMDTTKRRFKLKLRGQDIPRPPQFWQWY